MTQQTNTQQDAISQQAQEDLTLIVQGIEPESISIKPSIAESERFIKFLNHRFNLELRNDLIILIHETSQNTRGYFKSVMCEKIWKADSLNNLPFKQQQATEQKPLNSIVLSSHTLKDMPYMVLAHELAHYINFIKGIKDCSGNQYHNKHFKAQAEKLLLKVERDKRKGYAYTETTPEFLKMLEDFKPDTTAFKVFQETTEPKTKPKSRLLLFMCDCGFKIRCAKNENKPLNAVCQYCNSPFMVVEK
jgi:hypothetical protein